MLNKIIKKHPFKLITGIMLAGSLINPAQASGLSADSWSKGDGFNAAVAKGGKGGAVFVVYPDCETMVMGFIGVESLKGGHSGVDMLVINGTPVKVAKETHGWKPATNKGQDYAVSEFKKKTEVKIKGSNGEMTITGNGFQKLVKAERDRCIKNKALAGSAL